MMYAPLKDTLVIGMGHKARHGKNAAARFIQRAYPGLDIQCFAFADALKSYCRVELGMTTKDGPMLQREGVRRRWDDPDVWIRALYWTIAERQPEVALITDMRFHNEVAMVKQMGGSAVKVERKCLATGAIFYTMDRDPNHVSEVALDGFRGWDAVITNPEGDLQSFERDTLAVFRHLFATSSRACA